MPAAKKTTERNRPQPGSLLAQYRAIGPAAIVAALIHAKARKAIPAARNAA